MLHILVSDFRKPPKKNVWQSLFKGAICQARVHDFCLEKFEFPTRKSTELYVCMVIPRLGYNRETMTDHRLGIKAVIFTISDKHSKTKETLYYNSLKLASKKQKFCVHQTTEFLLQTSLFCCKIDRVDNRATKLIQSC